MNKILVGIPQQKRSLGKSTHKWNGNIFKEMAYKGLNLIKMVENRVQWQALLNNGMYL
jgi:hypothetical protein